MDRNEFLSIIRGSKRYEFDDNDNFEITDYFTGKSVTLDLTRITQEMLDELIVTDEEDEYDDEI